MAKSLTDEYLALRNKRLGIKDDEEEKKAAQAASSSTKKTATKSAAQTGAEKQTEEYLARRAARTTEKFKSSAEVTMNKGYAVSDDDDDSLWERLKDALMSGGRDDDDYRSSAASSQKAPSVSGTTVQRPFTGQEYTFGAGRDAVTKRTQPTGKDYSEGKTSLWEHANLMAAKGLSDFNKGVTSTLALLEKPVQAVLPGAATPLSDIADYYDEQNRYYTERLEQSKEDRSRFGQIATDVGFSTVAALPNAILALMSGGTSMAAQGGAALGATSTGLAASVGTAAKEMVKNPLYWSSMIQTLGTDYEEAKANGASDLEASASALISSALNAGVEIGGGLEVLPDRIKRGGSSAIYQWVKGALEEGQEEVVQGVISGITEKAIYDREKDLFSMNDPEAVINPVRMAEEGLMGAAVGGILGGGQIGAVSAANAVANRVDDRRMGNVGTEYQAAAEEVVNEGLSFAPETKAFQSAQTLKSKMDAGETVTDTELGWQVYENERAIRDEERIARANSEPSEVLLAAARESVAQEANVQPAQPVAQAEAESEPVSYRNVLNQPRQTVKKADPGYGTKGTEVFNSILESTDAEPGKVRMEFQSAYEAGLTDLPRDRVHLQTRIQEEAYNAGRMDSILRMKKTESPYAAVYGKKGGFIETDASKDVDRTTVDTLNTIGKELGIKIRYENSVYGGMANGSYENGIVTIARDADNPDMVVAKHEITHHLEKAAPKQYMAYRNYAVQIASAARGMTGTTLVEDYQDRAANAGVSLTAEQAMDEIAADFTEKILRDEKALQDFARDMSQTKEKRTVAQKFFEAVRNFIDKVKKAFKGNKTKMDEAAMEQFGATVAQLEKAEKLWKEAYKAGAEYAKSGVDTALKDDVFYSDQNYSLKITDQALIDFLEDQEYIVTYKAMQVVGENNDLHPPMAAKVKGPDGKYAWGAPSKIGVWQQATEDPTHITKFKEKNGETVGYYTLNKGNGKNVADVAYAPYEHSSNYVINDQFEEAHQRDNLVVVECHIPVSEMGGTYKAQYAHNATGIHDWKKGDIGNALAAVGKVRKVYLTRYLKPVRILSHEEVAQKYKEILGDVAVPFNVVSPSLLAELEKVGVVIDYKGSKAYQGIQRRAAEKAAKKKGIKAGEAVQTKQYSLKDSEGKTLTKEQQEFFKDSKVRDTEGNLLPVYHTSDRDFTVFDKARKGEATGDFNTYLGFFFTDDPDYMKNFAPFEKGKTRAFYLNMTHPLDMTNLSRQAFMDVVEVMGGDVDEAAELYDAELAAEKQRARNRGDHFTIMDLPKLIEEMTGEYDYADFFEELRPSYDALMAKGYDGVISFMDELTGTREYIVLESEQAKLTSNKKPTKDADVRFSLKDTDIETAINQSMTMQQAKDMVQRAFVLGEIKEWFEGEYRNGDEWLKGEGVDAVAMVIDNEWQLQEKYLNKIQGLMDEDFMTTDILEAYLAGTLTGKQAQDNRPKRLNVATGTNALDDRFYAPHQIENAKAAFETASQKVTNKNRDAVYKARADVIMFAHTRGAAEALGLTQPELNKKLSTWARYTARARETSQRFNAGVADWNKWTGIENSNILTRVSVSNEDLDRLVGEITGDSDGFQRKYIMRTMLALDTHIDYSGLNFEFVHTPDSNRRSVNGIYSDSQRKIRVKYNAPNTVAHEMGHYLDYQWARDIGVSGALTDGFGRDRLADPDVKQWAQNFDKFKDSLTDGADLYSSYTMDAKEVFARFVDKFVRWVNFTANGEQDRTAYFDRNDKFTAQHYIEFVRLLQEKSVLDGKKQEQAQFSLKNLDEIKAEYKDKTDHLYLHERRDGTISIDNMVVKKEYRNQGIGTQILNDVMAYADDAGKTITLTPTSEFGTKAKLTKWYKSHGFVENKGRNADYRLSDTMYRLPKSGVQFSLKGQRDLMAENAKLKETVETLREQFQTTKFAKVDRKSLDSFTKKLLQDYSSGADINETRDALDELYTYLANGENGEAPVWNEAYKRAYETAVGILEASSELNDEMYREYSHLRKQLKTYGMTINPEYDHDLMGYESINEFRKANFGRIKLVKNGTPVDVVYHDLAATYPEFFDDTEYVTQPDQLSHIAEVLDSLQPVEVNRYSHDMREHATWLANDILERFYELPQAKPTFADKAEQKLTKQVIKDAKKLERVRLQKNERIKQLIESNREKVKKAQAKERAKREEAVQKVKEHYKAKEGKASESRKAREMRAKILRHTTALSKKLLNASDRNHIPQELQGPVAKLLECINMESNYTYDAQTDSYKKNDMGSPTLRTRLFANLRKVYANLANELTIDPDLLGEDGLLTDVVELADKKMADMAYSELETIWKAIRAIEASIQSANIAFNQQRYATISEWAEALRMDNFSKKEKVELDGPFGVLGKAQKLTGLDMMTPEAYFHRLGNAGDGLFRLMRDAQDDHIRKMKEVSDFTHAALKGVDVRKLESKMHTVTLGGKEVQMSTAQIMELYVLMNREQAREHIMVGGILPDVVSQGKLKKVSKARPVRGVQMSELLKVFRLLTDEQKKVAETLQAYASNRLSEWGNEAAMKVYNYEKFGEKAYWPIRVNKQETRSDVQKDTQVTSVGGRGFTKGTKPHANNSVMIGSIFDTFSTHASEMATYAAWLAPMEDINRIRNFTFKSEGQTIDTVKAIIDTVHGKQGTAYLSKLLADLSNGVKGTHGETAYMSALVGNYKAASVGANLRVIIQQPTAMLRAMDMLGPQYLAAGVRPSRGWAKAKKYAPIAQWKDWGYFDINTGRQMKDVLFDSDSVLGKVRSASMWGAGAADSVSWGILWNAVETETKHKRKDLKAGSEEFYQAVAERFTEIVDHTQVVDGILQRSQIMRGPDMWTKVATSFMGEPTKQYNMMMSAAYDAFHGSKDLRRAGKKKFARAAFVLAVSGAANAMAQAIMDAVRDDDKEKEYWEKWLSALTGLTGDEETTWDKAKNFVLEGNLGNTLNPAAYIPYVKDFLSLLQGYDVSRMDMESIEKTLSASQNMLKALNGEGKYTLGAASATMFAEVSRLLGIPVANLKREVKSFAMLAAVETDNYLMQYRMEKASLELNYSSNRNTFMDILFNAYQNDREAYDIIYADMVASGFDKEKLQTGMESRMKKAEGVKSVSDLDQRFLHPDQQPEYDSTMSEIKRSGLWSGATEKQRNKVEEKLYDLVTDSKSGEKLQEKINEGAAYGLDEAEYLLYTLALDMNDQPDEDGDLGSYTSQEKAAAITSLDIGDSEMAFLWDTDQGYEAHEYGISMDKYIEFKANVGDIKADKNAAGKSISGSRKKKIIEYLNDLGLTYEEYLYLLGTEYDTTKKSADYKRYFGG